MGNIFKVGYLISYDYEYLKSSLPTIYEYASSITIAVDKDRKTWAGNSFDIPESFFVWIKKIDIDNKIRIYEDSFFVPGLTPMESETRERNMLAKNMGESSGWHIQIDADEYFIDFKSFTNYLQTLDIKRPTLVHAELITLFKQNNQDYFYIDSNESYPLATNTPHYTSARGINHIKQKIYTKYKVLHQSWARSEEEITTKMNNWGHKNDFNTLSYLNLWKSIDRHNYIYLKDFHPLDRITWNELKYANADNINQLIKKIEQLQIMEAQKSEKKKKFSLKRLFKTSKKH